MERSYTTIDKAEWGPGDWSDEPDKIQWVDEATGFDCLIVRHPRGGHLCGYVGLPPEHPCHGVDYDRVRTPEEEYGPDVHGGLTYAEGCQEGEDESKGICHVPLDGRPDKVWWLGFDCAHLGDSSPGHDALVRDLGGRDYGESYKTVRYVRRETERLAAQLVTATVREADDDA